MGDAGESEDASLDLFCRLDDTDVISAMKEWRVIPIKYWPTYAKPLLTANYSRFASFALPVEESLLREKKAELKKRTGLGDSDLAYLAFTGEAVNQLMIHLTRK